MHAPRPIVLIAAVLLAACARDAPEPAAPAADLAVAVEPSSAAADTGGDLPAIGARTQLDARPIVGQGEAGVQAMLGSPQGCDDVAIGRRCAYAQGRTEVTYIDGMADHIVIGDLAGAAFEPATIARIGLAGAEPLNVGPDTIEWQNVGGMRSIVLERGADGRASRFVIKAMTP
jgi:hypothetical protein